MKYFNINLLPKILENHHHFKHNPDLRNEVLGVLMQNSKTFQIKSKVFFNTYSIRKNTESQKNNTKFNVLWFSYSKNNWFSFQQKHTATILKNNRTQLSCYVQRMPRGEGIQYVQLMKGKSLHFSFIGIYLKNGRAIINSVFIFCIDL